MNQGKEFKLSEQQLDAQTRFNNAVEKLKGILTATVEGPLGKMADMIASMAEMVAKIPGIENIMNIAGIVGAGLSVGLLVKSLGRGSFPGKPMYTSEVGGGGGMSGGSGFGEDIAYDPKTGRYRDKGGRGKMVSADKAKQARYNRRFGKTGKFGGLGKAATGIAGGLGALAKGGLKRIPMIGGILGLGSEFLEGGFNMESLGRGLLTGGGGFLGGLGGTALGGALGLGTGGAGALAIPALAIAGGIGGSMAGDKLGDLIFGERKPAEDFISRPGQPIQKFRKDDIVIGGTDPFGNTENSSASLTKEMSEIKNILSQILNKEGAVYIDGNKVGKSIVLADSRLG
jgi:hypothetical protein